MNRTLVTKTRHRVVTRGALALAGFALAGCATAAPVTAATAPGLVPGVLVVPASSHVTGTYRPHCARAPGDDPRLPVVACTPGSIRSDIDPGHLELTVCKPRWSDSVRPPTPETDRLKTQAMLAYGVPETQRSITELDHDIPESLGGSSDATNLWPEVSDEPGKGIHNSKDDIETSIHAAVCRGQVRWRDAVVAFVTNWTTAMSKLGLTPAPRKGLT